MIKMMMMQLVAHVHPHALEFPVMNGRMKSKITDLPVLRMRLTAVTVLVASVLVNQVSVYVN